jgi:hypothetical protein
MVQRSDEHTPLRVTALGEITLILKPYVDLLKNTKVRHSIQRAIVHEVRSVHAPLVHVLEHVRDELLEYPPLTLDGEMHDLARILTDALEEYGLKE